MNTVIVLSSTESKAVIITPERGFFCWSVTAPAIEWLFDELSVVEGIARLSKDKLKARSRDFLSGMVGCSFGKSCGDIVWLEKGRVKQWLRLKRRQCVAKVMKSKW